MSQHTCTCNQPELDEGRVCMLCGHPFIKLDLLTRKQEVELETVLTTYINETTIDIEDPLPQQILYRKHSRLRPRTEEGRLYG